jgi:hypothetical protein
VVCVERDGPIPWFFDTLKSECNDGRETAWRCIKAHERRLRGSTRPRPLGESLEEVNARRGSASRYRVTPACLERTPWMRKSLKPRLEQASSWPMTIPSTKRHEGQAPSKGGPATGEGKPLKVEAQGRHRHETRPEGLRAEQSVKRLRKPEGAAQPGEANPVWVAARF